MNLNFNGLRYALEIWRDGAAVPIGEGTVGEDFEQNSEDLSIRLSFDGTENNDGSEMLWKIVFRSAEPIRVRMLLRGPEGPAFHVVPAFLFGDNQAKDVRPGEFPLLTGMYPGERFCSPLWEMRADRGAMPVCAMHTESGVYGISVDPYSRGAEGKTVRNGLIAELPAGFGISLGYSNRPTTFVNKRTDGMPLGDSCRELTGQGIVYCFPGEERTGIHRIIRREYARRRDPAHYSRSLREAAEGLFYTFIRLNWDAEAGEYTNRCCRLPDWKTMRPWRNVTEIGWTGGGILALPMLMYETLFPGADYEGARTAREQFDRICGRYHEKSGMIYDLMTPNPQGSDVNGWWTGFGLVRDCHCSYNTGTAVYALLYAADFLRQHGEEPPALWEETGKKVLDAVTAMQREDGAFGYTYALDRREVLDWNGFAGCWFVPALALLYRRTRDARYLEAAEKAIEWYGLQVRGLSCWGTPMDTWKAVDQEGNLAFIRGCSLLYRETKKPRILEWFRLGAEYEFLWRYGYTTRPENAPISDGWTACGGSVTSVSNPHIHPMGVLVNQDLLDLAEITGDEYYRRRGEDGIAWLMQTLELYPEKTGYGQYGVLSERWCPSDGLVVEQYADGRKYSSWFSYNLWAAANALQSVCEAVDRE